MSFLLSPFRSFPTGGGGGGGGSSNVLAAQVLDFQPEESASDVGATPDVLEIEVFN